MNYRLHIMAKVDLFKNPILAWILRRLGAFPVSRGSSDIQSVKTAMQAIKSGDNLLIFPEGTTIHNGIGYVDGLPAHAKAGVAVIGRTYRGHAGPRVRGRPQEALPPDPDHLRRALYAGVYRPPRHL